MITITIPEREIFIDEEDGSTSLVRIPGTKLQLEHSLISLRKWESIWHKAFLSKRDKTLEEIISYIKCMTINVVTDERVYEFLPRDAVNKIINYLEDPYSATTFRDPEKLIGAQKNSKEIVTAETIYWWLIALNIPVEFQKWNLNQLLTLIKFVNAKNNPKKMNKADTAKMYAELNRQRRSQWNTKG